MYVCRDLIRKRQSIIYMYDKMLGLPFVFVLLLVLKFDVTGLMWQYFNKRENYCVVIFFIRNHLT